MDDRGGVLFEGKVVPSEPPNLTSEINCPLREAARAAPEAPAILGAGCALSYGALDRLVSGTAGRLYERGWGQGARVALCLSSSWSYLVLLMALIRAGGVACPLSTRVPPQGVARQLQQIGCWRLLTDDPALRALDAVETVDPAAVIDGAGTGSLMEGGRLRAAQPATVLFTSGSSGTPRAALHTFGTHYYSALGSNLNIRLAPRDRWLLSLPLYHVGGLAIFFRCLLGGAAVVVPPAGAPLGASISTWGVSHLSLVSTQLVRMLREQAVPAEGLRAVLLGGSALPAEALAAAHARGLPLFTSYGLTEMGSQVTTTPPGAGLSELRTAGRVLPYRQLRVAPDGEILVRGATLFEGYVDGEAVHRSLDAEGWFHTGDLGRLDAWGNLSVAGRKDNLFISGGENIQPEEIEQALCRLAGVRQAVVVPVPDAEFGHRPVAFVQAGAEVRLDGLRAQLEQVLPRFKVPQAFYRWSGPSGGLKPDRAALHREALRRQQERT